MANRDIFVLRESFAELDDAYQTLIVPYLDFFGFPYREVRAEELTADCALILAGADALGAERVRAAVQAGAGLVCFADARRGAASEITFEKEQYITALHQPGEVRALYAPMSENASTAGTITFLSILSTLAKNFTPPRPMMTMKTTLSTSPSIMV